MSDTGGRCETRLPVLTLRVGGGGRERDGVISHHVLALEAGYCVGGDVGKTPLGNMVYTRCEVSSL